MILMEILRRIFKHVKSKHMDPQMVQILVVNLDKANLTEKMTRDEALEYLTTIYKEQPLQHFNDYERVFVVHSETGKITRPKLKIIF